MVMRGKESGEVSKSHGEDEEERLQRKGEERKKIRSGEEERDR